MAEFFESNAIWIIWIIFGLFFLIFMAMAPCHAVLLLPFMGLPLFWLLPLEYALPINVAAWLATPFLYRVIRRAMRKPPADGFRSLIGTQAEVVSRSSPDNNTKYLVRAQCELWTARCRDILEPGETVNIVAVNGISLIVERGNNDSIEIEQAGARTNERHCH